MQRSDDFLGHPRGLAFLFASEMWERFSYYGMRALLVLYMVNYLLTPERMDTALGLNALKRGLETLSGPLGPQPFASQIYGLYTGLVYLAPILGGAIADRWLGRTRTIVIGAALMAIGHFMMAFDRLFLIALLCIAFGCGGFKPNISVQVGELYARADARRDRAYSIFYVGINIGAFFAPLVCGTVGERIGWHYGFACAGVGMAIGLATYVMGLPSLPSEPMRGVRRAPTAQARAQFRRSFTILMLLFAPSALFWAAFEQQGNTIALWAAQSTDRGVDVFGWRAEIPVTWFQAFNPLMIFLFTPPLVSFWSRLSRAGREPSTISKMSLGCLGVAVSYGVMALAAWTSDGGAASWLWLLAFFGVITVSELHFSPIALSLVSHVAPEGSRSALMGVWFTSMFLGNLLAGWLGSLWSSLSNVYFFLLMGALGVVGALIVEAARRPLGGLLSSR
ncbi:peptide MFS transporter [Methylocystis suflitae]|uniref:peptide MFS transporter n=1 Tax=Methylocystis suflitae TaxID=2951405 RepID=UPI00210A0833|nr:peptide MFS transporter [Methylocystis suflitae]MCQ4190459.1 peptide MFS transporter [Methylocystis suflitae]